MNIVDFNGEVKACPPGVPVFFGPRSISTPCASCFHILTHEHEIMYNVEWRLIKCHCMGQLFWWTNQTQLYSSSGPCEDHCFLCICVGSTQCWVILYFYKEPLILKNKLEWFQFWFHVSMEPWIPDQFLPQKTKFDSNFGSQIQFLLTWTGTNGWPLVNPQALITYILEKYIYPGLGSGSTHK